MNIVVLSEKFWPEGSGGELATYIYVKGLLEKTNYNITIITGTPREKIPHDILKHRRLSIINFEFLRTKHRIILWKNLRNNIETILDHIENTDILYIPGASIIIAQIVKRHFKNTKIVYHLHGYMPLSYNSAVYYPYEKRKKRIYTDTCRYASRKGFKYLVACLLLHRYLTSMIRKSLKYVDKIICVSKRQEYIVNDAIPWIRGKTTVIYNPPPPDAMTIDKKPSRIPLLLFTGGDNPVKGLDRVIKVTKLLKKQRMSYKLIITNNVNIKLVQKIKKKLGEHIEFKGKTSREELLEIYSKAWILLFPSIYEEPLPYAIMEALLTGTIPIASKVGGVPELVNNVVTDTLFEPSDVNEMYKKIMNWIDKLNAQSKPIFENVARRSAIKFEKENSIHKLVELFKEQ